MILAINTAQDKKSLALFWPGKIKKVISWQSNQTDPLEKIEKILKPACRPASTRGERDRSNKHDLKDIKLIVVNRGPGSFTGSRVGVAIANALSFSLEVPIVGLVNKNNHDALSLAKKGYQNRGKAEFKPVFPYYGKKPNITKPRDRKILSI